MTSETATSETMLLPPGAHDMVARILRVAFPHPRFPDGPYQRTATAIIDGAGQDPRLRAQLFQGLRDLDTSCGRPFTELDESAAFSALEAIAGTPFFQQIRGAAITGIYDDREVWELLGYQGASFDQGGYLERGFDDLDWLPNPSLDRAPEQNGKVAR